MAKLFPWLFAFVLLSLAGFAVGPSLENSSINPFSNLTSTSNFEIANYDFNFDNHDDIIIKTSSGIKIFDIYNNQNYSITTFVPNNFFIGDFNADGYGDILMTNSARTELYLYRYVSAFTFINSTILTRVGTDVITYFGAFNLNNDIYNDIAVVQTNSAPYQNISFLSNNNGTFSVQTSIKENGGTLCGSSCAFIDIDNNGVQDISSYSLNDAVFKVFIRNSTAEIPTTSSFESISIASSSKFFYSQFNSNGQYGLIMQNSSDTSNRKLDYYNITSYQPFTIQRTYSVYNDISGITTLYSTLFSVDLLSNDTEGTWFPTNQGTVKKSYYSYDKGNALYNDSLWINNSNGVSSADIDNDGDADLIYGYFNSARGIGVLNNTINTAPNFLYTGNIMLTNITENISAYFTSSAAWQNYNYLYKVSDENNTIRNDFFDSQLNMKYYVINSSNNYTFAIKNSSSLKIDFGLNKYSNILAPRLLYPSCRSPSNFNITKTGSTNESLNTSFSFSSCDSFAPTYTIDLYQTTGMGLVSSTQQLDPNILFTSLNASTNYTVAYTMTDVGGVTNSTNTTFLTEEAPVPPTPSAGPTPAEICRDVMGSFKFGTIVSIILAVIILSALFYLYSTVSGGGTSDLVFNIGEMMMPLLTVTFILIIIVVMFAVAGGAICP